VLTIDGNVAEKTTHVDQEVGSTSTLEEDTKGRDEDGADDLVKDERTTP
jgi:hypothetical protein